MWSNHLVKPLGLTAKWAQARAFYVEDLASGFVRVQMELWAAILSNAALREQFVPRFMAWRRVIGESTVEAPHAAKGDLYGK